MTQTVVHYLDSTAYGGCEAVVLSLLRGFDKNSFRPVMLHHESPSIEKLIQEARQIGVDCHVLPPIKGASQGASLLALVEALRVIKPEILHAHLNWPLGCRYGIAAAKISRIKRVVATSHLVATSFADVRFAGMKQWLQAAMIDRYIAVSAAVKKSLCQSLGVPDAKVRVVPNGISAAPFTRNSNLALRSQLTEGRDIPLVLTPARLHEQKGHAYLLQAATLVPEAKFIFAGDGPERVKLELQCRQLGLEERVSFLGQRDDVPELLAACDLFVLPSLYEGMPVSVLEAMAAGKPVIATNVGGTDEVVINENTGVLLPPMNAAALATSITRLLADRALAARLAENGRKRATEMFSIESMVRGVTNVYDEVLGGIS